MQWKCLRCGVIFNENKIKESGFPCECTESPSPWEPVPVLEIEFEKVEVNSGTRKIDEKWTFELDPEIVSLYGMPETRWSKFTHWVKHLFIKSKIQKL
jgi:hypothetical protein